ncbi:PREDICTED: small kinetochore-associated protein [Chrysochloris asiatica]|uniref:Small kinetochore-associated protein n=1 Tax=Chrysochloris asiatica TaxID=185453 RepID=A0A9B0T3V8_CHRAS|nr:PREDICTED: small kinetochore-associated protein [Chrysochloris asiatica]
MAAPEAIAPNSIFRTTWLPTERESHSLPPSYRKFPFETEAVDAIRGAAVASACVLSGIEDDCWREKQALGVQPCRLVTMTSVVKTVYTLPPPSMQNGSLPSDRHSRTTSKSLLPVKPREVDSTKLLNSGGSETDVTKIIKLRRENGQMKAADTAIRKNVRKSYKPLMKQRSEEDLKDKNQLLEAVNKQLHLKLTKTQGELKDLTQKVELLEKFQDNCLAILESKGINPVLGSETLASQQDSTTDHTDSMLLLETLQDELKFFNETAKKQMEELQALKVKLKTKEEERIHFLEQQNTCNNQVNDFTTVLEEMEQLLEM